MIKNAAKLLLLTMLMQSFSMVVSPQPLPLPQAQTALAYTSTNTEYVDRYVYQAKLVNQEMMSSFSTGFDADEANAFKWFRQYADDNDSRHGVWTNKSSGFSSSSIDGVEGTWEGSIEIYAIPELKKLAEGGHAKYLVKVGEIDGSACEDARIEVKSESGGTWSRTAKSTDSSDIFNANSGWRTLGANDILEFKTYTSKSWPCARSQVLNIRLYFADIQEPSLEHFTFTHTGKERFNSKLNQMQLFLKKNEKIDLSYKFNEQVTANGNSTALKQTHYLFMNPAGTGLPAAGVNQGLSVTSGVGDANTYVDQLTFNYTAADYHHTGNLPIENGGDLDSAVLNDTSLIQKLDEAEYHDAAGNPLNIDNYRNLSEDSSEWLVIGPDQLNPFDYPTSEGYRVIVDAVPPKYTLTGNGIQPEILTGSTLNKGDVIDFKVTLTEDAIVREGWNPNGLYLYLNNGMKAYYTGGMDTSVWTFRANVAANEVDVSLLKVLALTHDSRNNHADKEVIQDYAGNFLMDAANANKTTSTDPSQAVPFTKIDWAKLAIDNQKPVISYNYEAGGANATVYQKKGRITIDANDPSVTAPAQDPDEPGQVRPSRGIYRPLNMTGVTSDKSPGVGLVYYYWSKSNTNPLASKAADQFAGIKRYSLTGISPGTGLYPGEMSEFQLMVANNKTNVLSPPAEAYLPENSGTWYLHAWTADMTWDTARELMQYTKKVNFKSANAAQYQAWKAAYLQANPNASDADAELDADKKAFDAVGDYSNLTYWPLADYKNEDSNWIYNTTSILLDNQKPVISFLQTNGNQSPVVTINTSVSDAHSGVQTKQFQFVKTGSTPTAIGWNAMPDSGTITTLNNVITDGSYDLYVKVTDKAGNTDTQKSPTVVTVDSTVNIQTSFAPEPAADYANSQDVTFTFSGIPDEKVEYAWSESVTTPTTGYTDITASKQTVPAGNTYQIPKNTQLNGNQYLHVRVKETGKNRFYHYYKSYKLDHIAPAVSFSVNGISFAKPSHEVSVTATESLAVNGFAVKYQWIRQSAPLPSATAPGWTQLPAGGNVTIDNSGLGAQEAEVDYVLVVHARDGAGNETTASTNPFKVSKETVIPFVITKSDLVYLSGNQVEGYTGIVRLGLQDPSVTAYEYSITTDNGSSWSKWTPYSNFVSIKMANAAVSTWKVKVKFRYAGDRISDPFDLVTSNPSATEPVYALVDFNTLRPVNSNGVTATVNVPVGIKVEPAAGNPMTPVRLSGNTFQLKQNGLYRFTLTDTTDSTRTDTLEFAVSNVDLVAPTAVISYNLTGVTNGNVQASLVASETIRVTNNDGKPTYVFLANGSFTFQFEDAAGNSGTATATVNNIDKTPPSVKLVRSYQYGLNGASTYRTILNANQEVVMSEGVTLTVQKKLPGDEDFTVLGGESSITLKKNGSASFTVLDAAGNRTVLNETITTIVNEIADPTVTYTFVDDNGNVLANDKRISVNGKWYAKGKMKVSLSGKVNAPNKMFNGIVPVKENGNYTNLISDANGNYSSQAVYSANGERTMAVVDELGHIKRVNVTVDGLDNEAPELKLKSSFITVAANKNPFDFKLHLGGFTVKDNVFKPEQIQVTISGLDLSKLGKQKVIYTAKDPVGNTATVEQNVLVASTEGMMIVANDQIVTSAIGESILFDRNDLTFDITRFNEMKVKQTKRINELAKYDIFYQSGLYREGQMKYVARKITMNDLLKKNFKVVFPKTGWYTIIVRTQEREREYATFFIGKLTVPAS